MHRPVYLIALLLNFGACKKVNLENPKEEYSITGAWEVKSFKHFNPQGIIESEGYPDENTKQYYQFKNNSFAELVSNEEEEDKNYDLVYNQANHILDIQYKINKEEYTLSTSFIDENTLMLTFTFPNGEKNQFISTKVNKDLAKELIHNQT